MSDAINNFHLLRPYWLLLLPVSLLLTLLLWRYSRNSGQWQRLIRPELLQHLLEGQTATRKRWPLLALLSAWLIAIIALAGPTWQKLPQPVYSSQDAVVLILDLSPSMMAQDLPPNRLTRARHRLIDLINSRQSGLTGLVVYAGDAHLLAPLSDDRQTLLSLVPSLSPQIMPLRGSQSEDAVKLALALLKDAGQQHGKLVLLTDGIAAAASDTIKQLLRGSNYTLSIIGVGTVEGAPIPLSDGSFVRNNSGKLQLARLQPQPLQSLAASNNGIYRTLSADDSDNSAMIAQLQPRSTSQLDRNNFKALQQRFDLWQEFGPWLVLLLLPIAALGHRRGWLYCLLLLPPLYSEPAMAWQWHDLWQTDNQQAQQQLQQGDYPKAVEQFDDPQWRAASLYRNQQYDQAAEQLKEQYDGRSAYNRGNALAKAGKLEQAIAAYQQALQLDPTLDDARFNQQLVERLLAKQNEQKEQENNEQQSGDGSDSNQQPGDNSDQQQDQQHGQQNGQQSNQQQGQQQNGSEGSEQSSGSGIETGQQPSAKQEPSAGKEPSANKEASADQKPSADKEQSTSNEAPGDPETQAEQSDNTAAAQASTTNSAEDAELERWLRQLPDDPGGLLRRKFQYQYQQKLEAYRQGRWQPPEETRW